MRTKSKKRRLQIERLEPRVVLSNYYVSPTGSDSNNGSAQAPWKTLQQAADMVSPGDTVDVMPGNYQGFNIITSGTAALPITFKAETGAVINKPMSLGGTTFGINASGPSYNIIDGFTITAQPGDPLWYAGIRMGGIWPGGAVPNWATGNVIRNNVVQLRVVKSGVDSRNNDSLPIFTSWQDGTRVENNTVSGGWNSGIYMSNSAKNYTVRGNTVYNIGGNGIHNNGDAGQGGPGINTNAVIENNIIHDVGFATGGQAISCDGLQNSTIRNNLIYNASSKGISLYVVNASDGSKNNIVVNNTVYTIGGSAMRMVDSSTRNTLLNNIFISDNPIAGSLDINSGDMVGMVSDYNVVGNRFYSDGSKLALDEWQDYGFDLHSVFTTNNAALFVNSAGNDCHLAAGSPAIGAGTATDAPSTDLVGNPRPSGKGYDIGAYEYQFGTNTTVPTVTGVTPAPNATGVPATSTVTATFNESIQAATLSFVLTGPNTATVPATVSYNDTTHTATLTPSAALAASTTYKVTISGAKNSAGGTMASPVSCSFTTAAPATTPTVTGETPAPNATGVPATSTVTATFNKSIQAATLSFVLTGPNTATVPATVSYNDTTHTATLTPSAALAAGTTYTATVSGAKDAVGSTMAGSFSWSFTTASTSSAPLSLWSSTATPAMTSAPDDSKVEVGVKFYSDKPGFITGLRFYKGPGNTGTHVGHLWSSTGQLLASATFTRETASGWQQVNFAQQVSIAANTTYVASYYASRGHYAYTYSYFVSRYNSGPLHVPANGGVYTYGTGGGFPNQSYQASNYWVDVVATTSTSPMTATISAISGTSPTVGSSTATGSTPSQPNGVYLSPRDVDQVLASTSSLDLSTPSALRRKGKRA